MFHETPSQPPAPQVGRDEKHLEHPVRNAREGGETAAGTADDPEPHRRQRLAPHQRAVETDLVRSEKVVRGAHRRLPKVGQRIQVGGRGIRQKFDVVHPYKSVWLYGAKIRKIAASATGQCAAPIPASAATVQKSTQWHSLRQCRAEARSHRSAAGHATLQPP